MPRLPRATLVSKSIIPPDWRYYHKGARARVLGVLLFLHKQNEVLNAASMFKFCHSQVRSNAPAIRRSTAPYGIGVRARFWNFKRAGSKSVGCLPYAKGGRFSSQPDIFEGLAMMLGRL